MKTCFPQILSFSISIDLKWRDVEGEKGKGRQDNTPGWKDDLQRLQTLLEIHSSEVNSRQSQCFNVSLCSRKKPTELHMQPVRSQIPAAASFLPQQLSSWLVHMRMELMVREGRKSKTRSSLKAPSSKEKVQQVCHTVPGGDPSLPPPK